MRVSLNRVPRLRGDPGRTRSVLLQPECSSRTDQTPARAGEGIVMSGNKSQILRGRWRAAASAWKRPFRRAGKAAAPRPKSDVELLVSVPPARVLPPPKMYCVPDPPYALQDRRKHEIHDIRIVRPPSHKGGSASIESIF